MIKVSVIIPAYNEEAAIFMTLKELQNNLTDEYEIIVIDDGSKDNTYDETKKMVGGIPEIRCIKHHVNRGYGSAIKSGVEASVGEIVVWYDADGQHRPEDLIGCVNTLIDNNLDYCIGVRDDRSFVDKNRRLGKRILAHLANFMSREPIQDVNSGLRAFKKDVLERYLSLLPKRFGASTVTTFVMQEADCFGGSYPIVVRQRIGTSTVRPFRDGMRTLWLIIWIILQFRPIQVFATSGVSFILIGCIYGVIEAITEGEGIPVLAAILVIFGIQEFFFGIISAQISSMRIDLLGHRVI